MHWLRPTGVVHIASCNSTACRWSAKSCWSVYSNKQFQTKQNKTHTKKWTYEANYTWVVWSPLCEKPCIYSIQIPSCKSLNIWKDHHEWREEDKSCNRWSDPHTEPRSYHHGVGLWLLQLRQTKLFRIVLTNVQKHRVSLYRKKITSLHLFFVYFSLHPVHPSKLSLPPSLVCRPTESLALMTL